MAEEQPYIEVHKGKQFSEGNKDIEEENEKHNYCVRIIDFHVVCCLFTELSLFI